MPATGRQHYTPCTPLDQQRRRPQPSNVGCDDATSQSVSLASPGENGGIRQKIRPQPQSQDQLLLPVREQQPASRGLLEAMDQILQGGGALHALAVGAETAGASTVAGHGRKPAAAVFGRDGGAEADSEHECRSCVEDDDEQGEREEPRPIMAMAMSMAFAKAIAVATTTIDLSAVAATFAMSPLNGRLNSTLD